MRFHETGPFHPLDPAAVSDIIDRVKVTPRPTPATNGPEGIAARVMRRREWHRGHGHGFGYSSWKEKRRAS
jgi:hypothetical protein